MEGSVMAMQAHWGKGRPWKNSMSHGGARAAEYAKKNLFSNLLKHPMFISDIRSAIADSFSQPDSELLKLENNQQRDAGSTDSTAIPVDGRLVVANIGDSRAVISQGGNAIAVSQDHKADQSDERQQVEDAGGFVMWAGTWRVGGVLAVSRAFGDRLLKQYVVADPEIQGFCQTIMLLDDIVKRRI